MVRYIIHKVCCSHIKWPLRQAWAGQLFYYPNQCAVNSLNCPICLWMIKGWSVPLFCPASCSVAEWQLTWNLYNCLLGWPGGSHNDELLVKNKFGCGHCTNVGNGSSFDLLDQVVYSHKNKFSSTNTHRQWAKNIFGNSVPCPSRVDKLLLGSWLVPLCKLAFAALSQYFLDVKINWLPMIPLA